MPGLPENILAPSVLTKTEKLVVMQTSCRGYGRERALKSLKYFEEIYHHAHKAIKTSILLGAVFNITRSQYPHSTHFLETFCGDF